MTGSGHVLPVLAVYLVGAAVALVLVFVLDTYHRWPHR